MIAGMGTDLVSVQRMDEALERHGERFAKRILTSQEFTDWQTSKTPGHFLAKRFAAKEAAAKALGTGFRGGMSLQHIGVGHDSLGKPLLEFTDAARQRLEQLQVCRHHLSLTDEKDYAAAFVILEKD